MWSLQTHYRLNSTMGFGLDLHGVNSTHQVLATGQWVCPRFCDGGSSLNVEADLEGTTVGVGYSTAAFSIGIGFATGNGVGLGGVNRLVLRVQL
jgi:hypothetical protein